MPIGSREIQKTKVYTVLWDTLYICITKLSLGSTSAWAPPQLQLSLRLALFPVEPSLMANHLPRTIVSKTSLGLLLVQVQDYFITTLRELKDKITSSVLQDYIKVISGKLEGYLKTFSQLVQDYSKFTSRIFHKYLKTISKILQDYFLATSRVVGSYFKTNYGRHQDIHLESSSIH